VTTPTLILRRVATDVSDLAWRWDVDAFVKASEAGVFGEQRVELIDGVVVPVVIGDWHGSVTFNVGHALKLTGGEVEVTGSSLATGDSVPDPDCWVRRRAAEPVGALGRLSRWAPADVLLVVEVSDETLLVDLGPKADLYARAGLACYWVVHPGGIEVMTDATPGGYLRRRKYSAGERVPVPYLDADISVDDILPA